MPSSFIFAIYFVNFSWRRRAALSLILLWCLIWFLVLVVVFVLSSDDGGLVNMDTFPSLEVCPKLINDDGNSSNVSSYAVVVYI